jgi:signal peptidase I
MADLIPGPSAASSKTPRTRSKLITILIYVGAVIVVLILAAMLMFFRMTQSFNLKAFRVPSDSMCPTICLNERIIVAMDAFDTRLPKRGEVILFNHQPGAQKFLKRVVAFGGDTVAPGPGNTIIVNGKAVDWPEVCGNPLRNVVPTGESVAFSSHTVPEDSFFVVGDNLNNSFDSRFQTFGLVKGDQVAGKPLFLYWSPGKSRIGCPIR